MTVTAPHMTLFCLVEPDAEIRKHELEISGEKKLSKKCFKSYKLLMITRLLVFPTIKKLLKCSYNM